MARCECGTFKVNGKCPQCDSKALKRPGSRRRTVEKAQRQNESHKTKEERFNIQVEPLRRAYMSNVPAKHRGVTDLNRITSIRIQSSKYYRSRTPSRY